MIRTFTLLALLLALLPAIMAQNARAYLFLADAPLAAHHQKAVYEVLHGMDPRVVISLEEHRLKVSTAEEITATEMLAALAAHGVHMHLPGQVPTAAELRAGAPLPWTEGIPNADEAARSAAKEAWIQAHPDAYLQMQQGEAPAPTHPSHSDQ